MKHELAEGLTARRATQLAWFLECLDTGNRAALPQCRMISSRGAGMPVGQTPNGPVLPFIIFSQGVKRDGDDLLIAGGSLENFRANPRMLYAHDQKGDPVGNWIPETLRAATDPTLGAIIGGHARPLSLDDGSETARRSATIFRMLELHDLDSISGSWNSEDVELIRNRAGRVTGIRHLKWEALEGSVVPIGSDPGARQRMMRALQERDGLIDERDRDFFSRALDGGEAAPYIIFDRNPDEAPTYELPAAVAAARVSRALAVLDGDAATMATAETTLAEATRAADAGPAVDLVDTTTAADVATPDATPAAEVIDASAPSSAEAVERDATATRFRVAFAPVVEALLAGALTPEILSRSIATLTVTDDLGSIEQALGAVLEQTQRIRSLTDTFIGDLADRALPATTQARAGKVLAGRNRSRLMAARDHIDHVLADGEMTTDPGMMDDQGADSPNPSERSTLEPDVVQLVTRLHAAVEELSQGRHASEILDELRRAEPAVRIRRAVDRLSVTSASPPA